MKVIGLTGGIATGKSTVEEVLRGLGIPTLDADRFARTVVEPGQPAYREIVERFGAAVLDDERRIDRAALAAIVYRDADQRRQLEAITHPRIMASIGAELARLEREGHAIAVVSAALLVEIGQHREYDGLLVVRCDADEQLRRLKERDGLTEAQARRRIEAQLPLADKAAAADWVIDTSGSRQRSFDQAVELVARWRSELGLPADQ